MIIMGTKVIIIKNFNVNNVTGNHLIQTKLTLLENWTINSPDYERGSQSCQWDYASIIKWPTNQPSNNGKFT